MANRNDIVRILQCMDEMQKRQQQPTTGTIAERENMPTEKVHRIVQQLAARGHCRWMVLDGITKREDMVIAAYEPVQPDSISPSGAIPWRERSRVARRVRKQRSERKQG